MNDEPQFSINFKQSIIKITSGKYDNTLIKIKNMKYLDDSGNHILSYDVEIIKFMVNGEDWSNYDESTAHEFINNEAESVAKRLFKMSVLLKQQMTRN